MQIYHIHIVFRLSCVKLNLKSCVEEKRVGWLLVPCTEIISRFSGGFPGSLEFYRYLIAFLLLIFVGNSIHLLASQLLIMHISCMNIYRVDYLIFMDSSFDVS